MGEKVVGFAAHEVIARVGLMVLEFARRNGLPSASILDGLPFDEPGLRRRLRIDWDDFCTMLERCEALAGGPSAFDELLEVQYAELLPELYALSGLVSPKRLFRIVAELLIPIAYPPLALSLEDLGPNRLRITGTLRPGVRPCIVVLRSSTPSFASLPRVLGLPPAQVTAAVSSDGAVWNIVLPDSRTLTARLRSASHVVLRRFLLGHDAEGRPAYASLGDVGEPERVGRVQSAAARWDLTPRQGDVLAHVVLGLSNKEIARALACAENTVELHLSQVFRKACVSSRSQLIARVWADS